MNGLDTLNTAKEQLRAGLEKGTVCECCKRYAKIYKRKLNKMMVEGLILMYRHQVKTGQHWIHAENFFKEQNCKAQVRGDFPKLKHWGLIEQREKTKESMIYTQGYYRVTGAGEDFIMGRILQPSYANIFDDTLLGMSNDMISVQTALKRPFKPEELFEPAKLQRQLL